MNGRPSAEMGTLGTLLHAAMEAQHRKVTTPSPDVETGQAFRFMRQTIAGGLPELAVDCPMMACKTPRIRLKRDASLLIRGKLAAAPPVKTPAFPAGKESGTGPATPRAFVYVLLQFKF